MTIGVDFSQSILGKQLKVVERTMESAKKWSLGRMIHNISTPHGIVQSAHGVPILPQYHTKIEYHAPANLLYQDVGRRINKKR